MKTKEEIQQRIEELEKKFPQIIKEIDKAKGNERAGLIEEGNANVTQINTLIWVLSK